MAMRLSARCSSLRAMRNPANLPITARLALHHTTPTSRPTLCATFPPPTTITHARAFTQTAALAKKGGGKKKGRDADDDEPEPKKGKDKSNKGSSSSSHAAAPDNVDPFDFADLDAAVARSHDRLKDALSKLRPGGRFNPELLEAVRVHPRKDSSQTVRLGDLGQVLPKGGRSVVIMVGDAEHVKPIVSAIQAARDLNLQPQVDAHNALQLNLSIPPPTAESRAAAQAAVDQAGDVARNALRTARADTHKKLRALELKKLVRPDDMRKAHAAMEKLVEKAGADLKKTIDGAKKAMEQ